MSSTGMNEYVAHSGSVSTVASTAKTILAVAGTSTQDLMLIGFRVSMDASSGGVALVEVARITALGTSSGSPSAVKANNVGGRAANGIPKSTFSVEPTYGDILEQFWLTPVAPTLMIDYTTGDYEDVAAGAANGLAIRVTPAASSTPNVRASLRWGE